MSEVEMAIKHFEALQKRYEKQHNAAQCKHVRTALAVLYVRQKKERWGEITKKPQTNADRIRGMSDEELAAWMCFPECDAERYETCITITTEKTFDLPYDRQTDPLHDVLAWLQQEVSE